MSEKRLLILGSVEDFSRLTQYAVERGIYTIVADAFPGEAKKYASKSYTIDLQDTELIDQIIREEHVDHVLSSFSDNMFEMMVYASERNNLECFCPAKTVRYLRDKILMKEMLDKLNINSAKGQMIDSVFIKEEDVKVPYPCVVKPLDGWGSKGMKIVHSFQELSNHLAKSMSFSTTGAHAMLEEINIGYELNVMSWVKDGEVYLLEFGDRETTGMTNDHLPHQSREIFPSFFYKELEGTVKSYLKKVADFCEIREGPLSMQFFYENGQITVGEVAGRFFGLGQGIVPVINGIDLNKLLVNMIYYPEENYEILENENKALDHCSFALYLLPERGIVKDLGNVMEFKNEHCDEFRVYVKPGNSATMEPWILRVYAHFNSREEADAYTENIYNNLFIPGLDGKNLVMSNKLVSYDGQKWKETL